MIDPTHKQEIPKPLKRPVVLFVEVRNLSRRADGSWNVTYHGVAKDIRPP